MSKKQLLIVDDNEYLRDALKTVFEDDYEVACAANGEEALAKYRKHIPQLVLMDYKMPGLNGLETLQRIKALAKSSPVVMMSAYNEECSVAATALQYGASDFVVKPFEIDQIRSVIARSMATAETKPMYRPRPSSRRYKAKDPVVTQGEVEELISRTLEQTRI